MDPRDENELMADAIPSKKIKCPACKKPVAWANNPHRPFCSERCATVDLGNWADNKYSLEGDPIDEFSEHPSDD